MTTLQLAVKLGYSVFTRTVIINGNRVVFQRENGIGRGDRIRTCDPLLPKHAESNQISGTQLPGNPHEYCLLKESTVSFISTELCTHLLQIEPKRRGSWRYFWGTASAFFFARTSRAVGAHSPTRNHRSTSSARPGGRNGLHDQGLELGKVQPAV